MSCATSPASRYELLRPRYWGLALQVGADLVEAHRRIRARPLDQLCAQWRRESPCKLSTEQKLATLVRVRRCANFALSLFYANRRRRCLPRSLVLYRWACKLDMEVSLHLAMHQEGAKRDGHCWIEIDGEPLFESERVPREFGELFQCRP